MKLEGGNRKVGIIKKSQINSPLVTIITVVYNGVNFIEKTIKSVKNLPYNNVEYLVIDGGSSDGTVDLLRQNEQSIGYWVSEPDRGIYDAMNKGWEQAADDSLVLFLGTGDEIYSLPRQEVLSAHINDIMYGTVMLERGLFKSIVNWKLKLGNTIHHQALIVPKKAHKTAPFNVKFKTYADYDFNLRLYYTKNKFIFVEEFKAYALPGGVSSQLNIAEMFRISFKHNGFAWGLLSLIYCSYQAFKIRFI